MEWMYACVTGRAGGRGWDGKEVRLSVNGWQSCGIKRQHALGVTFLWSPLSFLLSSLPFSPTSSLGTSRPELLGERRGGSAGRVSSTVEDSAQLTGDAGGDGGWMDRTQAHKGTAGVNGGGSDGAIQGPETWGKRQGQKKKEKEKKKDE